MDKKCSLESMPEEEVEVRFQLKARTLEGLLVYEKGSRKLTKAQIVIKKAFCPALSLPELPSLVPFQRTNRACEAINRTM